MSCGTGEVLKRTAISNLHRWYQTCRRSSGQSKESINVDNPGLHEISHAIEKKRKMQSYLSASGKSKTL